MSESNYKKYISYFQRVTTIGILTCAKSHDEAMEQAKEKLRVDDLNYCHFDQTEMELSDTIEWNPDFEIISEDPTKDGKALEWTVKIGEPMRNVMATRFNVSPDDLTDENVSTFVSDALQYVIDTHEETE
jgi:hypothetical protein